MEVELNSAEAGPLLLPTDAFNTTQTTFVVQGILHSLETLEESVNNRIKVLSKHADQCLVDEVEQKTADILAVKGFRKLSRYMLLVNL